MRKILRKSMYIFVFLCAMAIIIVPQIQVNISTRDIQKIVFNEGWTVKLNNDEPITDVNLDDYRMEVVKKGTYIELTNILPEKINYSERVALLIYPIHSVVEVYIGGRLVYEDGYKPAAEDRFIGYGHAIVSVPEKSGGKEIKIIYTVTEDDAFSNVVAPEIYKEATLIRDYLQERFIPLLAALGLMATGGCVTLVAFFASFRIKEMERLFGIGSFALVVGNWSLCNYDLTIIFTKSMAVKSTLEYMSFYILVLPLFLYFKDEALKHKSTQLRHVFFGLFGIQMVGYVVIIALQVFNIVHFAFFVKYYQMFMMACAAVMGYLLIYDRIVNKRHKILFWGFIGMIGMAIRDLVMFNLVKYLTELGFNGYYKSYISLAAVVFVMALLTDFVAEMREIMYKSAQSEAYIQMAYTDMLTGLYTRRRCHEVLDEVVSKKKPFAILMYDLNGLKYANDTFGHTAGDELIVRFSNILKEAYNNGEIIARLGGDEFTVVFTKQPDFTHESKEKEVRALIDLDNVKHPEIPLSVSVGFAMSEEFENPTADDVFKAADKRMYADKQKYYEESGHNRRR